MDKKEWIAIDLEFIEFIDEDIVTASDGTGQGNLDNAGFSGSGNEKDDF